ncbi:hypothetical protein P7E02_21560 [Enterococcus hulanensis]|uniref:hypothetical protein n=1 Tax=Enterococcus hulanensis TaxID=2559929 RepID=UPI0028928EFF|nr:hypothetical protein [Enterococcus hulanensis]MDT2662485.1 hypothetical protein [Enterococcus hulanensis]
MKKQQLTVTENNKLPEKLFQSSKQICTIVYHRIELFTVLGNIQGLQLEDSFFAALAGLGISKITAGIAATFSISSAGASFLVGYMGIKAGMNAASLAKALDSNGNGDIALYKRHLRNYKNGPSIGTQHRTYYRGE